MVGGPSDWVVGRMVDWLVGYEVARGVEGEV